MNAGVFKCRRDSDWTEHIYVVRPMTPRLSSSKFKLAQKMNSDMLINVVLVKGPCFIIKLRMGAFKCRRDNEYKQDGRSITPRFPISSFKLSHKMLSCMLINFVLIKPPRFIMKSLSGRDYGMNSGTGSSNVAQLNLSDLDNRWMKMLGWSRSTIVPMQWIGF